MADPRAHQPDPATPSHDHEHEHDEAVPPGPTSYDRKQRDVGASLFLGGVVIIALLAVLIWQGLF